MAKVQPNFSWQKYEGAAEDQQEQFQYQLQSEHIVTANAINSTIDDLSYFTKERITSELWIDNQKINTLTITGLIVNSATTSYPLPSTIRTIIGMSGTMQDAVPMTTAGYPLPYIDAGGNDVILSVDPTHLYIQEVNGVWGGYTFFVTLKYTKV